MNENQYKHLLDLKPLRILCPICGRTHEYFGKKLNSLNLYEYKCDGVIVNFYFSEEGEINVNIYNLCYYVSYRGKVSEVLKFKNISQEEKRPVIKFIMDFCPEYTISPFNCSKVFYNCCDRSHACELSKHVANILDNNGEDGFWRNRCTCYKFEIGFEFDSDEFRNCMLEDTANNSIFSIEAEENSKQVTKYIPENEGIFKRLLYYSPMENMEVLKCWIISNKTVVKWLISIGGVYGAYKILSSKNNNFSVENIGNICMENLGFVFEPIKDKEKLSKVTKVATSYAGTYFLAKAILKNFTKRTELINEEEINNGIKKIDGIRRKDSLFPQVEEILPISISIIILFLMSNPVNYEKGKETKLKIFEALGDFGYKLEAIVEMIKLFIADKFNLDLSEKKDEEKLRKFLILLIAIVVLVFLYGNRTSKDTNNMQGLIKQIIEMTKNIAPTAFAVVAALLVENKLIKEEELKDIINDN